MKLRQIIILLSVLAVLGLIYLPILKEKTVEKESTVQEEKFYIPVLTAKPRLVKQGFTVYGQIQPSQPINVQMEVQGVIRNDNRSLKVGTSFRRGEILINLERNEAAYNLLARRSSFATLIASLLPDISIDHPNERKKWEEYLSGIKATETLSPLPTTNSEKEDLLLKSRNIPTEYYAVKAMESQFDKYLYVAPYDGVIVQSTVENGSIVSPGMSVLNIARNDNYEVKAPIQLEWLKYFRNASNVTMFTPFGDTVGTGQLVRNANSINSQTQSVDGFFSLKSLPGKELIQGMFLNILVNGPELEQVFVLPENAVINNTVQVYKDSVITNKIVQTVGNQQDSVFVRGLEPNDQVVTDPFLNPRPEMKFIAIEK